MITAVDSNVILDVLLGPTLDAEIASKALHLAELNGRLINLRHLLCRGDSVTFPRRPVPTTSLN